MHFDFEDSESSSTTFGSDGGESHVDDEEKADNGHGLGDGEPRTAAEVEVAGETVLSTGAAQVAKKRSLAEYEGEVVDLTRHGEVRARPVKRARRNAV